MVKNSTGGLSSPFESSVDLELQVSEPSYTKNGARPLLTQEEESLNIQYGNTEQEETRQD